MATIETARDALVEFIDDRNSGVGAVSTRDVAAALRALEADVAECRATPALAAQYTADPDSLNQSLSTVAILALAECDAPIADIRAAVLAHYRLEG